LNPRENSVFGQVVAVADAASLNLDSHLAGSRLGNLALHDFKITARFGHMYRFHLRHGICLSIGT
jgi:hypothetical protein